MATEMEASVTAMLSQARKVRSLAKNTLGSTLTGTLRILPRGRDPPPTSDDRKPPAGNSVAGIHCRMGGGLV